jgi:hypothetical protein
MMDSMNDAMEEALTDEEARMTFGEIDIKRAVSDNNRVYFRHCTGTDLWYVTKFDEAFPVPVSDIGTAKFRINEKALLLMRYMRKWNQSLVDSG